MSSRHTGADFEAGRVHRRNQTGTVSCVACVLALVARGVGYVGYVGRLGLADFVITACNQLHCNYTVITSLILNYTVICKL